MFKEEVQSRKEDSMRNLFIILSRLTAFLLITVIATACEEADNLDASLESSNYQYQSLVYLKSASLDDVAEFIVDCPGKGKNNNPCVVICHRPPGNPENSKTMILPFKAASAHLDHGNANAEDQDYLGECQADTGDSGGDDSDDAGDTGDGGDSGDTGSTEEDDRPLWCQQIQHIDANCDGFHDETGEPLF